MFKLFKCVGVTALAFLISGCGTIYVSNVRFTAVEVCSQELASRMHVNTGCLPPTRAENAQGLYLARYRLQLSPTEAVALVSGTTADGVNHIPSWIGRVFKARPAASDWQGQTGAWGASADGNLEFIPLPGAPERTIATELQVKTDISGIVEEKTGVGGQADAAAVVDLAIKAAGFPAGAVPQGLREVLTGAVLQAGYERSSVSAGKGTYYYVSMKPDQLDSLTSGLARCGWRINQAPGAQTIDKLLDMTVALPHKSGAPEPECLGPATGLLEPNVRNMLLTVGEATNFRKDIKALGIVIGAAILRTEGRSELCTTAELGLLMSGNSSSATTMSCQALKSSLDNFSQTSALPTATMAAATPGTAGAPGAQATAASPGAAAAAALSEPQKKGLLMSLSFEYARATYKTMQLYPHTSVLALHWIPLELTGPAR